MKSVVIVGAGQAGLQVAEALRTRKFDGSITLIGDEPVAPYNRPPLSKGLLLGSETEDQIVIRGPEALARKNIDLLTGTSVAAIDPAARVVRLADGRELPYDGLALCTGSRLRPLPVPGAELSGVVGLRTMADARAVAGILDTAKTLVVIGGGFIGLEVAAAASKRGVKVTVLEAASRLMARVVPPTISSIYAALHHDHGVEIICDAKVTALEGQGDQAAAQVAAVLTADGRRFAADAVIVGIGILPNEELAAAAGIACDRGIIVDGCSRTNIDGIVAAGDCTATRGADGSLTRLESVQNAVEQAKSAAAVLMGVEVPFTAAPWFWSDQYDVKLQIAGTVDGADQEVVRGNPAGGDGSLFYFRGGALAGVYSFNRPQEHMAARKLLDKRIPITPEQAADPVVELGKLPG